jgi:hypothetical protein
MSYDPNRPYGNSSDPYGQPSDPYGQPPAAPYGSPQSSVPYNQPQSGQPYDQPQSGDPYAQPQSGDPYANPSSGQPYNPTAPLPPADPYANPGQPYGAPGAPYVNPADPYGANQAGPYGYPGGQPGPGGYPPVPPPKKSKTGLIVGSIVAVVVIVIAVCSLGGYLLSKSGGDSENTASGPTTQPTLSPSLGSGSQSATPSAPASNDSRQLVQPAGAPFSLRVPSGFRTVATPSSQTTGTTAKYSSALATSQTETDDFLIVDAYSLSYDADAVSQTELATQFDKLVQQIGQDPASRQNVTYNGNKGFWYTFDFTTSKAYSYFLFHGTNEIQVRCQWADQESQIKQGCADMLQTLQITD